MDALRLVLPVFFSLVSLSIVPSARRQRLPFSLPIRSNNTLKALRNRTREYSRPAREQAYR